jgi:uncharacterized protein
MKDFMLFKDVGDGVVKDVDPVKGIVTGYFSIFGNKDSDGDIVMPGAYKRTLKANGPDSEKSRILHLFMHDSQKPLEKPTVLKEDKTGLYFESSISHTTLGKDVIQLYQDKVLTEHSIGYQIIKSEQDEKEQAQRLTELRLWEGSTVSWGANMDAIVSTVKSEGAEKKTWKKLLQMMDALDEALKGNYSDDTARQLEIQFKQLQQVIMSLAREDSEHSTPELDNSKVNVTADQIIKFLNINL